MTPTRRLPIACATLALLALGAGCVSVRRGYPEKRRYMLHVEREGPTAIPSQGGLPTLVIERFGAAPPFAGKGFVYRTGEARYESDFYNEFFVPPAAMVTEQTRAWLAGSGLFGTMARSAAYVQPDYALDGMVTAIYGDYSDPAGPLAVLEVQLALIREPLGEATVSHHLSHRASVPAPGGTPQALVAGWGQGLREALQRFEQALREDLPRAAP